MYVICSICCVFEQNFVVLSRNRCVVKVNGDSYSHHLHVRYSLQRMGRSLRYLHEIPLMAAYPFPVDCQCRFPFEKEEVFLHGGVAVSACRFPACSVVTAICVTAVSVSSPDSSTRFSPIPCEVSCGSMSFRCLSIIQYYLSPQSHTELLVVSSVLLCGRCL